MKHPFNYMGLLALPALTALLSVPTGNSDFLGFLGFLVFVRYFWVNPDELFVLTLRQAATAAFVIQCVALAPAMLLAYVLDPGTNPVPAGLGGSFAVALIFFCLYHTWLEWKEWRGMA